MGAPANDGALRWDEPAKTPPARQPARTAAQPVPPPATGRPPPAAQTPVGPPPISRSAPPAPYSPHGYVPPSYVSQQQSRPPDGFSSTLQQWQTSRESIPTRDQHESQLRQSLERANAEEEGRPGPLAAGPMAGPARRPVPVDSSVPEPRARKRSQFPVIRSVAVIVIAVVLLGVLQAHGELGQFRNFLDRDLSQGLPVLRSYPVSSEFKLNRVMSSTCRGPEMTYTVYIGIPMNLSGQQEIVQISPNPAPTTESSAFWTWTGSVTQGQKASVVIGYQIKATLVRWNLDSSKSGTVSQIPGGYSKYLGTEWKFTPADATISSLASQLAGGTNNTFEKIQKIYSYLHSNIAYQTNSPAEPKFPTETLSDKAGDCDDQSFLLGSLLRAQGIPAWMEMGLLYDQSRSAWGGHAWLRTYVPEPAGGGQEVQIDPANDEFLFRDAYRLTDYIDDGNGDHLENYYVSWRYTYSGAAPLREDRYDSIFYRPSDQTVDIATTGPGPGAQALGQLFRMSGFESGPVLLAMAASAIVAVGTRRRNTGG
jgi:transglutaminase-like putative cysteine protease